MPLWAQPVRVQYYVVRELRHCLLGCQDSVALGLIKPVFAMTAVPDEQDTIISHTADVPDQVSPQPIPDPHPSPIPDDIQKEFPALFTGLGCLQDPCTIQLADNAKSYCQYTARNVPLSLRPRVDAELTRMEQLGVIRMVTEPTDWCAAMVAVPKANGSVQICVDLKPLNESIRRPHHQLPTVEETLGQLGNSPVFIKIDANSGFWQIPLDLSSQLLTTFITPLGRYCFTKLPFGISSAPELFQQTMATVLKGLKGVVCQMDDILVHGGSHQEHDLHLWPVLQRLLQAGITLTPSKCQFSASEVIFLGVHVTSDGIRPDPWRGR